VEAYREWSEVWAGHRRVPRQVFDLGDKLVVDLDDSGRGAGSGVPVTLRFLEVVTLRNGRIALHEVFPDWEAGMRATGLRR
jgi:hypothetical protein